MENRSGQISAAIAVILLFIVVALAIFLIMVQSRNAQPSAPSATMVATVAPQGALPTAPPFVSTISEMPQGSVLATSTHSVDAPPQEALENCTYAATFLMDISIPDDTEMAPGQPFEKIWRVRNTGSCFWEAGTQLVFVSGDQMAGPATIPVSPTAPNETVDVAVNLLAPVEGGIYSALWQLQMSNGEILDTLLIVRISVPLPPETAVPTPPTAQPLPTETAVPTQQPLPTPPPTPAVITGWLGQYFNNPSLEGTAALIRDDPQINFNWGNASPAPQIQPDLFSARWTRNIQFPENSYTFFARSDDGVRIWVDNQLIISQWQEATGQTYQTTLFLTEGSHAIRVEYYEDVGNAEIQVWWEVANQVENVGWLGEYFATPTLSGPPAHVRIDPLIDFNWGDGAPAPDVTSDNFSIRWSGKFDFEEGLYTFTVDATDGVRVYIDDILVLDEMEQADRRTTTFTHTFNNDSYDLRVEYISLLGDAVIKLSWQKKAL